MSQVSEHINILTTLEAPKRSGLPREDSSTLLRKALLRDTKFRLYAETHPDEEEVQVSHTTPDGVLTTGTITQWARYYEFDVFRYAPKPESTEICLTVDHGEHGVVELTTPRRSASGDN